MMERFVLSVTLKNGGETLKVESDKITSAEYTETLKHITEKATNMAGLLKWNTEEIDAEIGQTWTK